MQYKLLGRSGLKVSELCLGTMGFGTATPWGVDKLASFSIMEAFGNAGGNFMDTANRYQDGMSEEIVGDFINQRDRDYWVIATKYSLYDNQTNVNASGNNRKNMMRSVEKSLKRLKTDFIDVLYLHIWDWLTPIDEVLRGLDDLVRQGKVTYIAISDTPAWMVSKGQTMAELMGWSQFVALQIEYSLLQRSPERDLIPMARHYGLTVTPWAPLAGGALTGKYLRNDPGRIKPDSKRLNDNAVSITKEVIRIAEELGVQPSQVALAWTMQQGFSSIPIVGATRLTQMEENLGVLNVTLDAKHLEQLDAVSKIDLGFPGEFYKEDGVKLANFGGFYNRIQHRG
ncbi:MAG TPA: aldo/keto reductase [Phnomibacter sp.]|nr:aldo/keto reductase [Phnomibacter sp.]